MVKEHDMIAGWVALYVCGLSLQGICRHSLNLIFEGGIVLIITGVCIILRELVILAEFLCDSVANGWFFPTHV